MNDHNAGTPSGQLVRFTAFVAIVVGTASFYITKSKAAESYQDSTWHLHPHNINTQYPLEHFAPSQEYSPNTSLTSDSNINAFSIIPIWLTVNNNSERMPKIGTAFSFQHNELGSRLAYAENDSDVRFYFANLNYLISLNDNSKLLLDGQFYRRQESFNPKNSPQTAGNSYIEANLYNLNAQLTINQLSLSASFSQVDAHKKNTLGVFDYSAMHASPPDVNSMSYWTRRQISDFNFNGEKVWQAGIAYNFNQIGAPGLTLGYTYTYGNDIKVNHPEVTEKYRESEHNFEVGYLFQKPQLKGLGLKLQYAQYLADKVLSEMNSSDNEIPMGNGNSDLRVYLDYSVSTF